MSKILISFLVILLVPLSLAYEVRCNEDGTRMELVDELGNVAENFRNCTCITMADRAFCVQDKEFKPFCYNDVSMSAVKQGDQYFEVGRECENGCREETGGCKGCCIKNSFSSFFGSDCYTSDHIEKCGLMSRFEEQSCTRFQECLDKNIVSEIYLEYRIGEEIMIIIPAHYVEDLGNVNYVNLRINEEFEVNAVKFNDEYLAKIPYDSDLIEVKVFVKYHRKDIRLRYTSQIQIQKEITCLNCNSDLLKQNSVCGIFYDQIEESLEGRELDPFFFIALALRESSCRYYIPTGAFQVLGLSGPEFIPEENKRCEQEMRNNDVTNACQGFKEKINTQARRGVEHFFESYDRIEEENQTRKIALALFAYNRGYTTMQYVEDKFSEGEETFDAMKLGCKVIYNGEIQRAYDDEGNDMCTYYKGYGACYPSAFIDNLITIAGFSEGKINPDLLELSRDTITQCLPS
jgi:hypothetical protein